MAKPGRKMCSRNPFRSAGIVPCHSGNTKTQCSAHRSTAFTDEPSAERIVWLFSLVLGHSRMMWGRFVAHQDLQTVLRCHIAAFEELGGVPAEILYDRMKTAVIGEVDDQGIAYNHKLLDL